MARISDANFDSLPLDIREALATRRKVIGGEPTWQKAMAHRPVLLRRVLELMDSFAAEALLPRRLRELAVVTVSKANQCGHCVGRHSTRLHAAGLSHATIDALLDPDCAGLDASELIVRDYAVAMARDPSRIRDDVFERLRAQFSEPEIVELTLVIANAGFFNTFNNALGIELDATHAERLTTQRQAEGQGTSMREEVP